VRTFLTTALILIAATAADAQRMRAVRPSPVPAIADTPEPFACALPPASSQLCSDGGPAYTSLDVTEVDAIVRGAAKALDVNTMTIAVVDRAGRPLAVFRKPGADPANDDLAVGVARTAAFFSHNMAPLSSRTVRSISGIHFPPGITNTGSAALYGIENTNRGCDFNVTFNAGKCLPRARRYNTTARCVPGDTGGCGPGIITGKLQPDDRDSKAVNAGGIPLYRILGTGRVTDGIVTNGQLLGAIGVVGVPGDPQRAEFAAATGAFAALGSALGPIVPVPQYPPPYPGNVFVDGIRLPFLGPDLRLEFNNDGLPIGVRRLRDTNAGTDAGTFVIANSGGCTPNEYLVGPLSGVSFTAAEVDAIVQRAIATAKKTRALIRLPLNSYARMVIAVADLDGSILGLYRMPDATVFSIDVAVAKARNVIWFSATGASAVTNRTIGFESQPYFPSGIDSGVFNPTPGPWYVSIFQHDLANACSQGTQPQNRNQNGVVFFAGSSSLYRNRTLIGGLGVSGDGIDQDDYVTFHGAGDFLPPPDLWSDQQKVDGVRLPMFKFPRQPEGVTECGGGPCG
jgi:uncharacterized protein GlcG (DUF336 family)